MGRSRGRTREREAPEREAPPREKATQADVVEVLSDMTTILAAMLRCVACPDCDGKGWITRGGSSGPRTIESRCECREAGLEVLAGVLGEDQGDEDESDDE